MLRSVGYSYLLCVLLLIESVVCYDYISNHNLNYKRERRVKNNRLQHHKPKSICKPYASQKHREVVVDLPTAKIDVGSFIQKPNEYAVDDHFQYHSVNSNENLYKNVGSNIEENLAKKSEKLDQNRAADTSDFGPGPFPFKDTINSRHLNLDSLSLHGLNNGEISQNGVKDNKRDRSLYDTDTSAAHNSEKCVLKQTKLQFVPNSKNDMEKHKKSKKRKIFCFTRKAKGKRPVTTLCTKTKAGASTEKVRNLIITKVTPTNALKNKDSKTNQAKRNKRDEESLSERDRQLRELDEIQRRVDAVNIGQNS